MSRIAIIGLPGAGKTTLACQVTDILALPHIELDVLYWAPNWTPVAPNLFRQRMIEALNRDRWLVEGNYCEVCDMVCQQADTLVWLDMSLPVLMARLLLRTTRHLLSQAELAHGNREQFYRCFLSPHSIFLKLLKGYRPKREAYLAQLKQPHYAHLHLIHLRSPQAVQTWLTSLREAHQPQERGRIQSAAKLGVTFLPLQHI